MNRSLVVLCLATYALVTPALAGWDEDYAKSQACFHSVDGDPRFRDLNAMLAVDAPTLDQLANASTPSNADVALIKARVDGKMPCRVAERSAISRYHPWMLAAADIRYFQMDVVYVQLMQRRITFGNANQLLQQSYLEFSNRWSDYLRARSEEERRAQAEAADALMRQARSAPPPPPGATRLNCRWIGPTLYCDAY